MITLDPPWQVATPIGDAECLIFDPGAEDGFSRFFCAIRETGEYWWFTQPEIRRNTSITDGRTRLTPFSREIMERFAPMRAAAIAMRHAPKSNAASRSNSLPSRANPRR